MKYQYDDKLEVKSIGGGKHILKLHPFEEKWALVDCACGVWHGITEKIRYNEYLTFDDVNFEDLNGICDNEFE